MNVSEGGVDVEVQSSRDGASEGAGDGVFFNPTQELNRDVTVAALRAYQEREPRVETYLDAMAASGIRGVRAAAEGYDVTCADIDEEAVALAESNLARNDLSGRAVEKDANVLLHEELFDVVDIDPFGTPIPFADAAFANARNLVCVTATDTAPLCGAHLQSGIRKYSTVPRNTDYHAEMGLRVLISAMVRTAARYDVAAVPVLSHVSRHYARTYLELDHRATRADALVEQLGHVYHCEDCLYREHEVGLHAHPIETCPHCEGTRMLTAGPIWLGDIADSDFARAVHDEVTDDMGEAKKARRLLDTVADELSTPTNYDQHRLCKQWGVPANSMDDFLADLRAAGYEASHAHYSGTSFKTDANVAEIYEAAAPEKDT
ncbi:tRNA (guanine26-N2/guanine27-N2)-dimethyltransferase [Halogranum gelatinilyticum]|uniref:tRNA (guanine(26)-N(2))-dimethyltransferase n=1 Tax=Halogranum gelatinilyticum TaxID=660521 RepID=A0A1G9PEP2_9EURY|nr:tRNA (guanine(26)-N(2))-dimethyltransferase [Halogranum gelatinilyticum]SDL97250.1 tRNA (guanine26-N2/guanine27-N2)-dimethyltransferase [Halogranum gelatinilyticum]